MRNFYTNTPRVLLIHPSKNGCPDNFRRHSILGNALLDQFQSTPPSIPSVQSPACTANCQADVRDVLRHVAGGYEGMPRYREKTRDPVRSPQELGGYRYVLQYDLTSIIFYSNSDYPGITTLGPNDALFAGCTRINKDKRRPLLDVPKMWIIGRYDHFLTTPQMLITGQSGTILLRNKWKRYNMHRKNC